MSSLSPILSRIFALVLLASTLLAFWAALVSPIVEVRQHSSLEAVQLERLIVRLKQDALNRDVLESQAIKWREMKSEQKFAFGGTNTSLVGAQVQAIAREFISHTGGDLKSTANLPVIFEAGYQKIGLRLELRSSLTGLRQLLLKLETHIPFLFIENIAIRGSERPSKDDADRGALSVRLDVYAFMRTEESS